MSASGYTKIDTIVNTLIYVLSASGTTNTDTVCKYTNVKYTINFKTRALKDGSLKEIQTEHIIT